MEIVHCAIYISGQGNKDKIVQQIYQQHLLPPGFQLTGLSGALYSTLTINEIIKEELIHEHYDVIPENKVSITTSSGGQQKKALLNYLLASHPDYIVVDGVFDNLDIASQQTITLQLQEVSDHIHIIQILQRKDDMLPFIKTAYTLTNNNFTEGLPSNANLSDGFFSSNIPPPLQAYVPEQNPLVQFNNVCVSYNDVPVVKNICWQINNGSFWQLIGPNGSGKSTLLSMIYGDNPKAYGQDLILFGKRKGSGESVWEIKKKIGYFSSAISQQFDRLDTIEQMIISGFNDSIGLYTYPTDIQIQLAAQWLQLLNLYKEKKQPFRNCSTAQQRLILIARAMVKHPPLLILDEPTAGLDDDNAALFTALVNKIAKESNTAILFVSHRVEKGLTPKYIFELTPAATGSTGKVIIA